MRLASSGNDSATADRLPNTELSSTHTPHSKRSRSIDLTLAPPVCNLISLPDDSGQAFHLIHNAQDLRSHQPTNYVHHTIPVQKPQRCESQRSDGKRLPGEKQTAATEIEFFNGLPVGQALFLAYSDR
jgi:hypothetical protein